MQFLCDVDRLLVVDNSTVLHRAWPCKMKLTDELRLPQTRCWTVILWVGRCSERCVIGLWKFIYNISLHHLADSRRDSTDTARWPVESLYDMQQSSLFVIWRELSDLLTVLAGIVDMCMCGQSRSVNCVANKNRIIQQAPAECHQGRHAR